MADQRLKDASLYVEAIERLFQKHRKTGRVFELQQDQVPLSFFYDDRFRLARTLSREVASGTYRFSSAIPRLVRIEDKNRLLYSWKLTDLIVHDVLARLLNGWLTPFWSPSLHSYRKKRSAYTAVKTLSAYLKHHGKLRPDVRTRGLFTLKRDIKAYTESIPVDGRSLLWAELEAVLKEKLTAKEWKVFWPLLVAALRPTIMDDGIVRSPLVGLPTGSPLCPIIFNFYLKELDEVLSKIPEGYYGRYGDDLLYLHPDAEQAHDAARTIDAVLARRALVAHPSKRKDVYWTSAGKPSANGWSGSHSMDWLGMRIRFGGEIGLGQRRLGLFRTRLKERIANASRITLGLDPARRATLCCRVINSALDSTSALAESHLGSVLTVVDDRAQLKELDHWIVRRLLLHLTGRSSPKAFRTVPYSQLRSWGLKSLVVLKHRSNAAPTPVAADADAIGV